MSSAYSTASHKSLNPVCHLNPPSTITTINLDVNSSGSIIFLYPVSADTTITMPSTVHAGFSCEFIVEATQNASLWKIDFGTGNGNISIVGATNSNVTTRILKTNAANALAGDSAKVWCDGKKWYATAISGSSTVGWATASS
jgi:hypothetical protein